MTIEQFDAPGIVVYKKEDFEGGVPPANITAANTGFDSVTNVQGGTAGFNANGYVGQGAVLGGNSLYYGSLAALMSWNTPAALGQSCLGYFNIPAYPSRNITMMEMDNTTGGVLAELFIDPNGYLNVGTLSGTAQVPLVSTANPVPMGQWVMIKMTIFPGANTGMAKVDVYYTPGSVAPDDSVVAYNVAIPGAIGQCRFGINTSNRSALWNIDVITNLGAPPVGWGGIVAAFQPSGFAYSTTNFGHAQTATPATASYSSTHSKSVNWIAALCTYANNYGDAISITDTHSYCTAQTTSGTPGTPVVMGTYSATAGAASHVCSVTANSMIATNSRIIVIVAFGATNSVTSVTDTVGNSYSRLASETVGPTGTSPVEVWQATTPNKYLSTGGGMSPAVTVNINGPVTINIIVLNIPGVLPFVLTGVANGNGAAISTATGAIPAYPATSLVIQHNWGVVNTWTAPVNALGATIGGGGVQAGYTSAGWQNAPSAASITMASTLSVAQDWARIHLAAPIAITGTPVLVGSRPDGNNTVSHACTIATPTTTMGQLLVVVGFGTAANSASGIVDTAGNAYTRLGSQAVDATGANVEVWRSNAPNGLIKALAAGNTVTVTLTASSIANIEVLFVTGCYQYVLLNSSNGTGNAVSTVSGMPNSGTTAQYSVVTIQHNWSLPNTWTSPATAIDGTISGAGAGYTSSSWQNTPGNASITVASTLTGSVNWARIMLAAQTTNWVPTPVANGINNGYAWLFLTTNGAISGNPFVTDTKGNTYNLLFAGIIGNGGQRLFVAQSANKVTLTNADTIYYSTVAAIFGWTNTFGMFGLSAVPAYSMNAVGTSATPTITNATLGAGMRTAVWFAGNDGEPEVLPPTFKSGAVYNTGGSAGMYGNIGYVTYQNSWTSAQVNPDASGSVANNDAAFVSIMTTNVGQISAFSITDTQGNAYSQIGSEPSGVGGLYNHVFYCPMAKALGAPDYITITCTSPFEGYAYAFGQHGIVTTSGPLAVLVANGNSSTAEVTGSVNCVWAPILISFTSAVSPGAAIPNPNPSGTWNSISNPSLVGVSGVTFTQKISFVCMSSLAPFNSPFMYYLDGASVQLLATTPVQPDNVCWVEILDHNLNSQGMVQYATVTATINYNAVGSYMVLVPYSDALWNQMMAGEFIIRINWRNLFYFGGKCETPGYADSIPGSTGGSSGGSFSGPFITLSGGDYLQIIANRICYPDPTKAWTAQLPSSHDVVVNVPLETAIKWYVNRNVGNQTITMADGQTTCPPALGNRQHNLLDIAPDQGRGPNVNYDIKYGSSQDLNLLDVILALIAQAGINMGVKVTQNGNRLLFDVYIPADKTVTAWFSENLGNLTSVSLSLTDPTITDSLVQGATTFVAQETPGFQVTPWNKIEVYNDSSNETATTVLQATAASALTSGAQGPQMTITAADTPFLLYGRDYSMGDKVTIEVRPGLVYQDVVSSATLTADPSQIPILGVVPTIGNAGNSTATDKTIVGHLISRIKSLEKKLAKRGL